MAIFEGIAGIKRTGILMQLKVKLRRVMQMAAHAKLKEGWIYPHVGTGIHIALWLKCFILPLLYCNSPVDCTIVSSPWVATLLWRFHSAWWWAVHSSVSMSWPGQQISLCPFCLFGTCQTSRLQLLESQRALQMVKIIVSCLYRQHWNSLDLSAILDQCNEFWDFSFLEGYMLP